MANKTTTEQMATPPFPEKMSFREMYDGLFNRDFLSEQEFKTICDTAEMYANGCIRECKSHPSASVEDAAKEIISKLTYIDNCLEKYEFDKDGECRIVISDLISKINYSGASWQASQQTPAPIQEEQQKQGDVYSSVCNDVLEEVYSAKREFPGNFVNQHEGYAVILEELDELWEEVKKNQKNYDLSAQRKEAIQCAAMCVRFIAELTIKK